MEVERNPILRKVIWETGNHFLIALDLEQQENKTQNNFSKLFKTTTISSNNFALSRMWQEQENNQWNDVIFPNNLKKWQNCFQNNFALPKREQQLTQNNFSFCFSLTQTRWCDREWSHRWRWFFLNKNTGTNIWVWFF